MLNYDAAVTMRADEILTGSMLNTRCGIGEDAWRRVTRIRMIDRPAPFQDRVEITLDTDAICITRESPATREYQIIPPGA